MFKFIRIFTFIIISVIGITACAPKKPPLSDTQIVNGKSIVVPPEFDLVPETTK